MRDLFYSSQCLRCNMRTLHLLQNIFLLFLFNCDWFDDWWRWHEETILIFRSIVIYSSIHLDKLKGIYLFRARGIAEAGECFYRILNVVFLFLRKFLSCWANEFYNLTNGVDFFL